MTSSLVTDATDEPGKIASLTEKVTPVSADTILINDSDDSQNPKKVQISNLPGGGGGSGDMTKAVYDPTTIEADAFARANQTGTQTADTISDFDTEVANETNVAANTSHRTADGKQHSDVVLNNTHRALVAGNPHVVTKTEVSLGNVDNLQQIPLSQKASANGVATLDASSKLPAAQLPVSATEYLGAWNATTNTPTLIDGTGTNGDMYRASVGGSQDLGSGSITLVAGDAIIYNGLIWQKIPSEDIIQSVNSQTGAVVLDTADILENTNLYYTEGRVSANSSVALNTAKNTNATHTGEVTGDAALTITNDAVTTAKILNANVTLAKIANIATARILGRDTAGSGVPEELTAGEVNILLGLVIGTNTQAFISQVTAANEATFNSGNPNDTLYILIP